MPSYNFRNKNTGEEFTEFMGIADREKYLEEHPELEQMFTNLNMVDPVTVGRVRTDNEFNSLLKEIKKRTKGDAINTR